MGSYDFQYKAYYDGIKSKSVGTYKGKSNSFDDYFNKGTSRRSINSNNKKDNNRIVVGAVNWFIGQLIITIILSLFIFGAKYSTNEKLEMYYNLLKEGVRKEYSIGQLQNDMKTFNISTVITKIRDSVKWVSDKIDSNPLNN